MKQGKQGAYFLLGGKHASNPTRETNPPKPSPPSNPTPAPRMFKPKPPNPHGKTGSPNRPAMIEARTPRPPCPGDPAQETIEQVETLIPIPYYMPELLDKPLEIVYTLY